MDVLSSVLPLRVLNPCCQAYALAMIKLDGDNKRTGLGGCRVVTISQVMNSSWGSAAKSGLCVFALCCLLVEFCMLWTADWHSAVKLAGALLDAPVRQVRCLSRDLH